MLKKIETKEILTKREARKKYNTQYFVMVITETVDQADKDLGYVVYTADEDRELPGVTDDEFRGKPVAYMIGGLAEPYPCIGNVVYYD